MLIFPLKKQWYEKIKSGEKTIEYREVKPYWTTRIGNGMHKLVAFSIYEPTELYEKISALGYCWNDIFFFIFKINIILQNFINYFYFFFDKYIKI